MEFFEKQYFVVATGTGVGKTFFVTRICEELRGRNIEVEALKPVESGVNGDFESDAEKILAALGRKNNQKNITEISPWRLKAGLSPSIAARLAGKEINFSQLKNFCVEKINSARLADKFLFIEAAGGVMTTLDSSHTFLDLIAELKIPVLLLGGNYLGAISHVLCAVEALKSRGCEIEKIIINDFGNENLEVKLADTVAEIKNFCKIETKSI